MTNRSTTPEQLYKDNERMAFAVLHKYFPTYAQDEDCQQLARLGLWVACKTWDPSRGKLSTLAYSCISHEIIEVHRLATTQGRTAVVVSLEAKTPGPNSREGEESELLSRLACVRAPHWFDYSGFLQALSPIQKQTVAMRLYGYSQHEIHLLLNETKQATSWRMKEIRKIWNQYI